MKEINDSILVLIPKVDHLEHIKQFRLIGLCNVMYKIVTKIIANWLKPYMNHLISPNQCSFVPKRHSFDNIIINTRSYSYYKEEKGTKRIHGN